MKPYFEEDGCAIYHGDCRRDCEMSEFDRLKAQKDAIVARELKNIRELIEEAGVILAEEEMSCGMEHVRTFKKLNEVREALIAKAAH